MTDAESQNSNHADYKVEQNADVTSVRLSGDWRHHGIEAVCGAFPKLVDDVATSSVQLDMSEISDFDTAGAWLLRKFEMACKEKNISLQMSGARPEMEGLLTEIPTEFSGAPDESEDEPRRGLVHALLRRTGIGLEALLSDVRMGLNILGAMIYGPQLKAGQTSKMSLAPIVHQIDQVGVRAVPIIVLMSLAIGAIISQQTAFQLRTFGADVFAADLVSVLQLREVGVLITSIMIAGRSGSAITAEIGSMKMREEVDALTVMGLNPISVLVFPRMIALLISVPLLTIVANFAALFAAGVVLYFYSDVPPNVFLSRMKAFIDYTTITSGMIKTPFMAVVIGVVSAVEGLKVKGSAESLGRRVTASVVKAIFLVIIIDGIFAIFYAAIDF